MPLFKINNNTVKKLKIASFKNEKQLQTLFEQNLEQLFGIKFIETEHPTGQKHGGRIDTLGLGENNSPVIIEYKWREKENIINQGLFYLDWLIDHRGDFQGLVDQKLGQKVKIDWSQPRLILAASSFNKFDGYAINRMPDNVELWTYSLYEEGLLTISLEASSSPKLSLSKQSRSDAQQEEYTLDYHKEKTTASVWEVFSELRERILKMPNVVEFSNQKSGISFRTTKSFARFEFLRNSINLLLREPNYNDPNNLVRDITNFLWGYSGLVKIKEDSDLDYIFGLVEQSYQDTL